MWKQKLGMSVGNGYGIPTQDIVKLIKNAGFDAISPEWEKNVDLTPVIETARQLNTEIQSLHAPFSKSDDMWCDDENSGKIAVDELLECLDDCHFYGIPILVCHTWIGFDNFRQPTERGIERYGIIVEKAKEYGIKIAFENTEGEEHLFALLDAFENYENVGFCWDSGHEMCYNHSMDLLKLYGNRLFMTHLNDNLGISDFEGKTFWTDDLHLLPYDGVADWDYNVERLKKSTVPEILNFELNLKSKPNRHENDVYAKMQPEDYLALAYSRACRIAYKLHFNKE